MLQGKAGAEAALCVALRSNAGAGLLRDHEHRGKAEAEVALRVSVVHGTAGTEAGARVHVHQQGMWLAVEGLRAKTCIQFLQRGRACYSKNSDKLWGSQCASEYASSVAIPRKTFFHKLYIQSS